MNSLAKFMQAFIRIAKDAILQYLCPKGMGVSMKKSVIGFISVLLITTNILTGCSSNTGNTSTDTLRVTSSAPSETTTTDSDTALATTLLASSKVVLDKNFTANDLEVGFEESEATFITLEGSNIKVSGNGATALNNVLTINDEGIYVISGTLADGQIIVDAKKKDKIRLVLNGAKISCSDNAPIYIKNADKTFITLEENTTNTLTDGSAYVQSDDNSVDGVIFSMSDLTLNGDGLLYINANYKHGIISKDELTFTGGTYQITAVKDALNGKDCVRIKNGSFTLSAASGNAIQSKNNEDITKGYVYIYGGTITIMNSQEGIEGTAIVVEGGTIDIKASDDGLNASNGNTTTAAPATVDAVAVTTTELSTTNTPDITASATPDSDFGRRLGPGNDGFGGGGEMENDTNCYLSISGGTIHINARGDGIDSNGSIYITGGNIFVSGPSDNGNAGMDYNGTADITGGTIIVAGSAGMAQGFSETSTQYSILRNLSAENAADEKVTLTDADDKVIITYTPENPYQSLVISSPDLADGETYTLSCGDQTADITISSIVTSNAQAGMNGKMFNGDRPDRGNMPKTK